MEQSVCAGRGEGKLLPLLTLLSSTVLKTRGQNPSLHCSLTWRGPPSGRHIHPLVCQDSSGETQARYSSDQLPEYRFKGWLKGRGHRSPERASDLPKVIQQVQGNAGTCTQTLPEHNSHNVLKICFCLLASGTLPWEPDVWALTRKCLRQI